MSRKYHHGANRMQAAMGMMGTGIVVTAFGILAAVFVTISWMLSVMPLREPLSACAAVSLFGVLIMLVGYIRFELEG